MTIRAWGLAREERTLTSVAPTVQSPEGLVHRLVHIDKPILRVPNICIHLARDMNTSFGPNKETHTG